MMRIEKLLFTFTWEERRTRQHRKIYNKTSLGTWSWRIKTVCVKESRNLRQLIADLKHHLYEKLVQNKCTYFLGWNESNFNVSILHKIHNFKITPKKLASPRFHFEKNVKMITLDLFFPIFSSIRVLPKDMFLKLRCWPVRRKIKVCWLASIQDISLSQLSVLLLLLNEIFCNCPTEISFLKHHYSFQVGVDFSSVCLIAPLWMHGNL